MHRRRGRLDRRAHRARLRRRRGAHGVFFSFARRQNEPKRSDGEEQDRFHKFKWREGSRVHASRVEPSQTVTS